MSVKSKRSAKAIAQEYQMILACEDGHWHGRGLELPGVHGDGKTVGQCVENTREAFCGWVAHLIEEGQRPPTPAREGTRTIQVNVRFTAEEKAILEVAAKRKGFSGLSDFVRAAVMEAAR
jgi:predicted RNase H-like HicB family nuclease